MEADISKLENDKQILQTSNLQLLGDTRLLDTVMAEKNLLITENNQLQRVNKQVVSEIDRRRIELERHQEEKRQLESHHREEKRQLESHHREEKRRLESHHREEKRQLESHHLDKNKSLQLEVTRLKAELESISALASNSKHKIFVSPVSKYFTKT